MLRENAKPLREAVQKFPPDCRLVLMQHTPLLARLILFSNKLSLSIRQQMDRIGLGQQTQGGWKPS
jgi:2-oxo-4-hydroxy-4-carboxy--5-ureidoimidazoline (OHCU) decarboxylase